MLRPLNVFVFWGICFRANGSQVFDLLLEAFVYDTTHACATILRGHSGPFVGENDVHLEGNK